MRMTKRYITDDGKVFDSEREAIDHEETLLLTKDSILKESKEYKAQLKNSAKYMYLNFISFKMIFKEVKTAKVAAFYNGEMELYNGWALTIEGKRLALILDDLGLKLEFDSNIDGSKIQFIVSLIDDEKFNMNEVDKTLSVIDNWC